MESNEFSKVRNIFEVDNARNFTKNDLVKTFIPTRSFWRLLSSQHHVILGARGQGKTALAKMISHNHLSLFAKEKEDKRARSIIEGQEYIGIYLPMRLEWVGGLNNKSWLTNYERERHFQWRLNIASCIAFLPIIHSCISSYVNGKPRQAEAEREVVCLLLKDWALDNDKKIYDLLQLKRILEDTDYYKQIQFIEKRVSEGYQKDQKEIGIAFDMDLFSPLRQGIRQLTRLLGINADCSWLICLDEAEFLDKMHHRILNSHMRAYPENLFFKMTTMPYCHYTLETNIGAELVPGHDFEYVNIDFDNVFKSKDDGELDNIGTWFGEKLFKNFYATYQSKNSINISTHDILGESELLDPLEEDWSKESENMRLLKKYATPQTYKRAERLYGQKGFKESIVRKINGALLLRKQVEEKQGNTDITAYSGAKMVIRCADGNPRNLIKIFNSMFSLLSNEQLKKIGNGERVEISKKSQTRALQSLSDITLSQVKSFPEIGPQLYSFLLATGNYLHDRFYKRMLTTDQVSSINIDKSISDLEWRLVEIAVGNGLLHFNSVHRNVDDLPTKEGTYRLSFSLSPRFLLLPRKGKAVDFLTIKRYYSGDQMCYEDIENMLSNQLNLFDEEGGGCILL